MIQFLEQMPGYEFQIGIGFLLWLLGAAAGSRALAKLKIEICSSRPELHRFEQHLRYSFWAVLLGTALVLIAIVRNPIVTI